MSHLPGRTRFPRGLAAGVPHGTRSARQKSAVERGSPHQDVISGSTGVQACVFFSGGSSKDAATWCSGTVVRHFRLSSGHSSS